MHASSTAFRILKVDAFSRSACADRERPGEAVRVADAPISIEIPPEQICRWATRTTTCDRPDRALHVADERALENGPIDTAALRPMSSASLPNDALIDKVFACPSLNNVLSGGTRVCTGSTKDILTGRLEGSGVSPAGDAKPRWTASSFQIAKIGRLSVRNLEAGNVPLLANKYRFRHAA